LWCDRFGLQYAAGLRHRWPAARRHLMTATDHRAELTTRFAIRHRVTGVTAPGPITIRHTLNQPPTSNLTTPGKGTS
jgi:hypothetical protein